MASYNEPKYDTDLVNKGYLDKALDGSVSTVDKKLTSKSHNFGSQPTVPYYVNDTWMNGKNIYICKTQRLIGDFNSNDWELASDYTNNEVANSKNTVFISEPVPPYKIGDLWTTGPNGVLYRCVVSRGVNDSFHLSDWENATSYDSTKTTIENGLVTSGTMQVVNGGSVAAGMTGNGSGDDAIRFWAGATFDNRSKAPFRVTQGGYLYASWGSIGGWDINDYKIYNSGATSGEACCVQTPNYEYEIGKKTNYVFAAGATNHSNYGDAKFRVDKNGNITATSGSIGGWNISDGGLRSANNGIMPDGRFQMYPTLGGIMVVNNGARIKGPDGIAIYNTHFSYDGKGDNDSISNGIHIMADQGNLNLMNESSTNSINIRSYCSPSVRANPEARCMLLASASNLFLFTLDKIWAEGNNLPNSEVLTNAGSSSSRNVKTNIVEFTNNDYKKSLNLLDKMKLYSYDYKYNIYHNRHKYGFIIDELEEYEETKDFFEFEDYNATIKNDKIDFSGSMDGEKLHTKTYNSDVLDKYLLTCIKAMHNEIKELKEEIKKLKESGN